MSPLVHTRIPSLPAVDVLVVGGGTAGCCAALAARESGRTSVLLVERQGFLGGTSTGVLDTFYGFFTPGDSPRKVAGGIPDRIVNALDQAGAVFLRPNTYGAGTGVNYNPERLKLVWDELLARAGVCVLLHAVVVDALTDSSGRVTGVVLHTRQGFVQVAAQRCVDASGDAVLCHHAGVPYERAGDLEPAQTLTTTFRLAAVDLDAYERAGGKRLLMERMSEAVDRGTHALPRKAGSLHRMNVHGCVATVASRVAGLDPNDALQVTAAEQEGRRQAFAYEGFLRDCVPGFAHAGIIGLSHQIGIRETRRVYGEYRLTRTDCLSVARFDDCIALCGAPIEDHRAGPDGTDETAWAYVPGGQAYDVPYRTLVPKGRDELWVAGRCFSATHDAHASCRSMAQTMSLGAAAGFAAALSLESDRGARSISIADLQERLRHSGTPLTLPGAVAFTASDDWCRNVTS
ncbi:MAG: FAD-dependent oxidoreductase [Opitutaceae bacterium]